MRYITLVVFIVTLATSVAFSQSSTNIRKIENKELIRILNELILISEKKTDEFSIRVFEVGNAVGSAGQENGEITHNLYIAVSEFGEDPKQNLFVFGPIYNPKIIEWKFKIKEQRLFVEYGGFDKRQRSTLKISLDKIEKIK